MRGFNQQTIIGNVGNDPVVKYLPDGTATTNLSIACNRTWKDKASGEKKEATEWFSVDVIGKIAEVVYEYTKKGDALFVQGETRSRKYTGKDDGIERTYTGVRVDQNGTIQFLSGKREGDQRQPAQRREPASPQQPMDGVPFDDDIPF